MAPGVHLQGQGQWGGCPSPPPPQLWWQGTSHQWGLGGDGFTAGWGGGGRRGAMRGPGALGTPHPTPVQGSADCPRPVARCHQVAT